MPLDDLNDLYLFTAVVEHKGFSAAARAVGIEKTRLSRRVAALEKRLGVVLLQRSTRTLSLTEAGERFYENSHSVVDAAIIAYESIYELKSEPSGNVRISCPVVLAQSYLAAILPEYMAQYPKVTIYLDSTDRHINLLEERVDVAFRANTRIENSSDVVVTEVGRARRILVASPAFLECYGHPNNFDDLTILKIISRIADMREHVSEWELFDKADNRKRLQIKPRLVSGDLRVQLNAAMHGIGVALLPEPIVSAALSSGTLERVLPEWSAPEHIVHLVYSKPRGMLPSVKSFIDYVKTHMPAIILERSA